MIAGRDGVGLCNDVASGINDVDEDFGIDHRHHQRLPEKGDPGLFAHGHDFKAGKPDLVAKHRLYGDAFTWDFIGHLQSRKTKLVLPLVRLIHSVDSLSAVQELQRRTQKKVSVLLEVNIAGEDSKSGVPAAEVEAFLQAASDVAMVDFSGLMCMPPLGDPAASARHFARTRELAASLTESWRGRYTFDALSMGTSSDYEAAVQEGATIVRIGSGVLFRQTLEG